MELAHRHFNENAVNKAIHTEYKQNMKELDVKMSKMYIAKMDDQERKQREEFERRNQKIKEFMGIMESNVIAADNKKMLLLETN